MARRKLTLLAGSGAVAASKQEPLDTSPHTRVVGVVGVPYALALLSWAFSRSVERRERWVSRVSQVDRPLQVAVKVRVDVASNATAEAGFALPVSACYIQRIEHITHR